MDHQDKLREVEKQITDYNLFALDIHNTNTSIEASLKLAREIQRLQNLKEQLTNVTIKERFKKFPESEAIIPSKINFEE